MSPGLAALSTALVALGTLGLGFFVYRQSVRRDAVVEKAGIATSQADSMGKVMEGLTSIGDALRADNKELRAEVTTLKETLKASVDEITARLDAVEAANTDLRTREAELERENALLRADLVSTRSENAALKVEIAGLRERVDELEKISG